MPSTATNAAAAANPAPLRGQFITLEGIDAAGKSTQAALLTEFLTRLGLPTLHTREPGGTPFAERLRALALESEDAPPKDGITETLLMFAARRDHVVQKIAPALAAGTWVVCDRFTDSTLAYQGGGRGVDDAFIRGLARHTHPAHSPDLTFLIASPPPATRLGRDAFERESPDFYHRVTAAYADLARADPHRIAVIRRDAPDGTQRDRRQIQSEIQKILATRLPLPPPAQSAQQQ